MGVSVVVGSGRLVLVGDKGESRGRVGQRGRAKQRGGIGTGRDDGPGIRVGSTK